MSATNRFNLPAGCSLVLGVVALTATLSGAGFWDKKDFTQWSEKEVRKISYDSPWAKKVPVASGDALQMLQRTGGAAPRGGGGGAPGGGGGLAGGGAPGGVRRGGGGGPGGGMQSQSQPMLNLYVRFDEALPVKQAKVKDSLGERTELTPEMQQYLDRETDYYVVYLGGLPQALARFEEEPERLASTARLRRKGHEDMYPAKVEVSNRESVVAFRYFFVKNDPIELSDKEVEFYFKLDRPQRGQGPDRQQGRGQQGGGRQRAGGPGGGAQRGAGAFMLFGKEIKRKFRLKEMVYQGELAL